MFIPCSVSTTFPTFPMHIFYCRLPGACSMRSPHCSGLSNTGEAGLRLHSAATSSGSEECRAHSSPPLPLRALAAALGSGSMHTRHCRLRCHGATLPLRAVPQRGCWCGVCMWLKRAFHQLPSLYTALCISCRFWIGPLSTLGMNLSNQTQLHQL